MNKSTAQLLAAQAIQDGWINATLDNLGEPYGKEWYQVRCDGNPFTVKTYRKPHRHELPWSKQSFSFEELLAVAEIDD